jgi:hypothetical protein
VRRKPYRLHEKSPSLGVESPRRSEVKADTVDRLWTTPTPIQYAQTHALEPGRASSSPRSIDLPAGIARLRPTQAPQPRRSSAGSVCPGGDGRRR